MQRFFIWAGGIVAFLLVVLGIAVAVAESQLPDYDQLRKRNDLGQMIRLRAADGSVLISLGPSFGRWLSYDQIPATMRAAMIAVEDKRFRSHPGIDPIGIARSLQVRITSFTSTGSISAAAAMASMPRRAPFMAMAPTS